MMNRPKSLPVSSRGTMTRGYGDGHIIDLLRIIIGISIILSSVYVGHVLQLRVYHYQHIRFVNCVSSGQKPALCSVMSVFSPNKFN